MDYCSLDNVGIVKTCGRNRGGVAEVYFADRGDVSGITVNSATGIITDIIMFSGKTFKTIQIPKNTASVLSSTVKNPATYNISTTNTLTMTLPKVNSTTRLALTTYMYSDGLYVIYLNRNKEYYLLGYDEPVEFTQKDAATGVVTTDANQYTVTMVDNSDDEPMQVSISNINNILDANALVIS